MKIVLNIVLLLVFCYVNAQDSHKNTSGAGSQTDMNEKQIELSSDTFRRSLISTGGGFKPGAQGYYFTNRRRSIDGTVYLFDSWKNNAIIYTKDRKRFLLKNNININIDKNNFVSIISNDSLYAFNNNNIDKIVVNNRVFKNYYKDDGRKIYEVIYKSNQFAILKGYKVQYVSGSPNPMINRKNDKYIRKHSYFLFKDNAIKSFRLKKKNIIKLFDKDLERITSLEKFMNANKLSYKKEYDIQKALNGTKTNN